MTDRTALAVKKKEKNREGGGSMSQHEMRQKTNVFLP